MKLISCNVEGSRHLDRQELFLISEKPNVLCLQEVCEKDLAFFESVTGLQSYFAPMVYAKEWESNKGVAILARDFVTTKSTPCGGGNGATTPDMNWDEKSYQEVSVQLMTAQIGVGGDLFRVSNVHLPVTEKGSVTDFQMQSIDNVLATLEKQADVMLCGDLNAPRGERSFARISDRYTDCIPTSYTTSIDATLHRAGAIPVMVDGLFVSPSYTATGVRLVDGVSDHMAVVAEVARVQ